MGDHGHATRKHGLSPTYRSWAAMHQRCGNPNRRQYQWYGGRGIKVCAKWHTFEGFLEDMGTRPGVDHSLGRIDHDGDYGPDNCEWSPKKLNARPRKLRVVK